MATAYLAKGAVTAVIAARTTASTAPTASDDGFICNADGGVVRTLVKYAGAVTAAVIRLWVHDPTNDVWHRGASSTDAGALVPFTDGAESRDWVVGEGVEFTFQLESITPSGSTPTVAVGAIGVDF